MVTGTPLCKSHQVRIRAETSSPKQSLPEPLHIQLPAGCMVTPSNTRDKMGRQGRVMLPLLDAVPSWMNETKHEISPNSLISKCKLKHVPLGYSFQCLLTLYCGNFVSCRFPETTLYWYKNIQMNLYFSTGYKRSAITELPFVNAFPMPDPAK